MGLALAGERRSRLRDWALPLAVAIGATALQAAGLATRLRYERAGIMAGELWRLLTGHLVHLGWSHLFMNLLGLALAWLLVGKAYTPGRWVAVLAIAVLGIDAGFWWLSPGLNWYVGLSGLLHAIVVAGAAAEIRQSGERRPEALVLLGLLALKVAYEQIAGPVPGSTAAAGGTVVVAAHLYGALAGAVAALCVPPARRCGESH